MGEQSRSGIFRRHSERPGNKNRSKNKSSSQDPLASVPNDNGEHES